MDKMCITDPRRSRECQIPKSPLWRLVYITWVKPGKWAAVVLNHHCIPLMRENRSGPPLSDGFPSPNHHAEVMPFEMCERIDSDENCLLVARLQLNFQIFICHVLGMWWITYKPWPIRFWALPGFKGASHCCREHFRYFSCFRVNLETKWDFCNPQTEIIIYHYSIGILLWYLSGACFR